MGERDVPEPLTELYRGPLDEFVARRTQLMRATRAADPSRAALIGKARKPPLSVWAIDQLAFSDQDAVAELLAAAADARDAQRSVAEQSETREGLVLASTRLREAVEWATRAAGSILERAGSASSDDTRRRISATLHAAATGGRDERVALWQGTLDREVGPSGFGSVDSTNDDPPELSAVLAPLRRVSPKRKPRARGSARESPDRPKPDAAARDAAVRAAEKLSAAAERARDLANAKRRHADTLALETRTAEADAATADKAATEAEHAAQSARAALDS